jgi:hypothetical protein
MEIKYARGTTYIGIQGFKKTNGFTQTGEITNVAVSITAFLQFGNHNFYLQL